MPASALATLAAVLSSFRPHFGAPSFLHFLVLAAGWLLALPTLPGGCVTDALVAARVSHRRHWEAFHRFFSRARWAPDRLGQTLLDLLEPLLDTRWLELAIDDTVCGQRGARVDGASMPVDPVTSTVQRTNLVRGHGWVQLGVVVNVPWSTRAWFVPLLSRLYRGKKEAGFGHRSKPQLARERLDVVLGWVGARRTLRLLVDSAYMTVNLRRGLPLDRLTVVGSLTTNAALFRRPVRARRGQRPRRQGTRLPTPAARHHDRRRNWQRVETSVSGKVRVREVLILPQVQWYGVLGERLVQVVLVREDEEKLRVVLCTDPTWTPAQVLEQGARRWSQEVWHREVKQVFGFADPPAWSELAVKRTAPWVALRSGMLVVWLPAGLAAGDGRADARAALVHVEVEREPGRRGAGRAADAGRCGRAGVGDDGGGATGRGGRPVCRDRGSSGDRRGGRVQGGVSPSGWWPPHTHDEAEVALGRQGPRGEPLPIKWRNTSQSWTGLR
jgi:hypothetical protein